MNMDDEMWWQKSRELEQRVGELMKLPYDTPAWEVFVVVVDVFNIAEYLRILIGNKLRPSTSQPKIFR